VGKDNGDFAEGGRVIDRAMFRRIKKEYVFLVEITFGFVILWGVNLMFFPADPGFIKMRFHPYWLVILFISAQYGLTAGIVSGIAAGLFYGMFFYLQMPLRGGIEIFVEQGGLHLPLFFVGVGLLLGNLRQKYIVQETKQETALAEQALEVQRLKEMVDAGERARRVLEARIVGETSTVKTLYDSARKLDALDELEVFAGCLEILQKHFRVQKAAIYLKEGDFLMIKSALGWPAGAEVQGKIKYADSLMRLVFESGQRLTVKDFLTRPDINLSAKDTGSTLAIFPVKDSVGNVIGAVNIERMDFFFFHNANLEIMDLIVEWLSAALSKAELCRHLNSWKREDDLTGTFYYSHFAAELEEEFLRVKNFKGRLSVAVVKIEKFGFIDARVQHYISQGLVAALKRRLRPTDKVFSYRIAGVFLVLAPLQGRGELEQLLAAVRTDFQDLAAHMPDPGSAGGLMIDAEEFNPAMADAEDLVIPLLEKNRLA